MKNILIVISILIMTSGCAKSENYSCTVTSVHDGDTFTCFDKTKIRVWGIDTPEVPPSARPAEPGGYEARDYLRTVIKDRQLNCIYKGKSYNRTVARCYLNNEDIAYLLLKKGLAEEKPGYSKGYYSRKNGTDYKRYF